MLTELYNKYILPFDIVISYFINIWQQNTCYKRCVHPVNKFTTQHIDCRELLGENKTYFEALRKSFIIFDLSKKKLPFHLTTHAPLHTCTHNWFLYAICHTTALGRHLIDPQNLPPKDWFRTICRSFASADGAENFDALPKIMRKGRFLKAVWLA